jgi:hypothetical protein
VVVMLAVAALGAGTAWASPACLERTCLPPEPGWPSFIVGTNRGQEGGRAAAHVLEEAGVTSERLELAEHRDSPARSAVDGFRNDVAIIGNTPNGTRLTEINQTAWVAEAVAQAKELTQPGRRVTLWEVGNEMYLKGGHAEPIVYAEMFMKLSAALDAAGILGDGRLLFDSFGSYEQADGEWSSAAEGRGWLGDALAAQPGLGHAVAGFADHPYGRPGEDPDDGDAGPGALVEQHDEVVSLGFETSEYWLTEFGICAPGSSVCGHSKTAGSEAEEDRWARTLYGEWRADGWVGGVWWYNHYDNSPSEKWGLIPRCCGRGRPRAVLAAISGRAYRPHAAGRGR